jgi:hypothetical protein
LLCFFLWTPDESTPKLFNWGVRFE